MVPHKDLQYTNSCIFRRDKNEYPSSHKKFCPRDIHTDPGKNMFFIIVEPCIIWEAQVNSVSSVASNPADGPWGSQFGLNKWVYLWILKGLSGDSQSILPYTTHWVELVFPTDDWATAVGVELRQTSRGSGICFMWKVQELGPSLALSNKLLSKI